MDRDLGVVVVVAAAAVALVTVFALRTRWPRGVVVALLVGCGGAFGVGGALIEGSTGFAQAAAASVLLAVLTPLHVRAVLGPLGRAT